MLNTDFDGFSVYYQPIVCSNTHKAQSLEALIRWNHKDYGFISPAEFIPLSERLNLIDKITHWVLQKVLDDSHALASKGFDLKISVNLSGKLIGESYFCDSLEKIMENSGISTKKIIFEITESSAMSNPEAAILVLQRLKAQGFSLAIDDFGTGYSSFLHLVRLPVDKLKIDRSFLMNINDNSLHVIRSIIDLSHNLKLKVVAEGVEDVDTLSLMQDMGCDYIQGYYFSKPIPLSELFEWLSDRA